MNTQTTDFLRQYNQPLAGIGISRLLDMLDAHEAWLADQPDTAKADAAHAAAVASVHDADIEHVAVNGPVR